MVAHQLSCPGPWQRVTQSPARCRVREAGGPILRVAHSLTCPKQLSPDLPELEDSDGLGLTGAYFIGPELTPSPGGRCGQPGTSFITHHSELFLST